ncbi:MAG: HlyD family secretion protein [Verrucomicrobia bacterium]|nr:MAG: HlyD family secretion protein [Verrucomicrobiota bacterium]PYJ32134.1 MAG: HlyD family secretion protein [Verrucomicrobiota bacterium]
MDLLIILTYAAFAFGAFKLFKIPVNGFSLLTAALGGIAILAALLLGMNYNHPFSSEARFYFNTTPIVPGVSGVVIEVPVKSGTMLKAGDVLFRIDPTPFENAVKAKEAALADALQTTKQLREASDSAQKKLESALADRDGAKDIFERSKKLLETGVIAQVQFERAKNTYNAAEATAQSARAEANRALLEAEAVVKGVNTDVARLQSDLDTAKFNLEQSVVRAPTDGTVQQNFLRRGMFAASMPLRPVMIFLHNEPPKFTAAFLQNSAQRIEEGSEAEFILPAVPGRFFKGKVSAVGAFIAQGQLQPSGNLIDPEQIKGEGRILVRIDPEEGISKYLIVPGSSAQVAIYTHHMHHLAILRKVLLRMKSWTNYLFSDGH